QRNLRSIERNLFTERVPRQLLEPQMLSSRITQESVRAPGNEQSLSDGDGGRLTLSDGENLETRALVTGGERLEGAEHLHGAADRIDDRCLQARRVRHAGFERIGADGV